MRLSELVELSASVARERGKNAKVARLAEWLGRLPPADLRVGTAYAAGEVPQGKIGVGWAMVRDLDGGPPPADGTLQLLDVDRTFTELGELRGAGSTTRRRALLEALWSRATADERAFLSSLFRSELRQGALASVVVEAAARAAGLRPEAVRRAAMLAGSEVEAAAVALLEGQAGLSRFALTPFRPVLPMLASPIDDATAALESLGEAAFEVKLDGARVQAHKDGDQVRLYSRSLHDVTDRAPEIVEAVRSLPWRRAILDGEAIALRGDGRPQPFQTTMRRFGRKLQVEALQRELPLSPFFFDVILADDQLLLDAPARDRLRALSDAVPASMRAPLLITSDADEAERFYAGTLAGGHEGLMAKSLEAAYEAGHRGSAWLKIKPAHTLDLVVLAVERGSGRRAPWLSNIHLGARDPRTPGGFAMIGKTFKGMTDEMLAWQTARFTALAVDASAPWVIELRPEQVVEVAFNDVLTSTEYPSGVALRFARVRRYRDDKRASDTNTIDEVRALLPAGLTASRRATDS